MLLDASLAPFSPLTPKILIWSANAQAQAGKKGGSHTYETLKTKYDLFVSKSPLFQQLSVEGGGDCVEFIGDVLSDTKTLIHLAR